MLQSPARGSTLKFCCLAFKRQQLMALFSKAFAAGTLFVAAANLNLVERAVHTAFVVLAVLNFARYALVYVIHHIKIPPMAALPPVLYIL